MLKHVKKHQTIKNVEIFVTDGGTDGPTNRPRCRVACTRLKKKHEQEVVSLQELRNRVLPCTFINVQVKRFFNFQTEERLENNF